MATGTPGTWITKALTIARTFLATSLLLGASLEISQPGFDAELTFTFELLLGLAIATGWLMRYAAALVLFGTVAAGVLTHHLHFAFLSANTGANAAVLIASGILICFGQNANRVRDCLH